MTRRIKFTDYIRRIAEANPKLAEKLYKVYKEAIDKLSFKALHKLLDLILENVKAFGTWQNAGRARAYLFEEFMVKLLSKHLKGYRILHGERVEIENGYKMEFDIVVKRDSKIIAFIECKVDMDAARLKTSALSLMLAKSAYPSSKTLIVYLNSNVDEKLLNIVGRNVDGIIRLNEKNLKRIEGKILH
ncbi:hypothetical protein DRO02_04735 [archaeon]|nr:MAG: hypothetical protein DRO02_04735 [archaeon]